MVNDRRNGLFQNPRFCCFEPKVTSLLFHVSGVVLHLVLVTAGHRRLKNESVGDTCEMVLSQDVL